ncbi:protein kinase domain-containing protein [Candidatus Uabimicrobium amorphum]|uniref:Protein kinase n=1 Tax=Uabimicrobium amorphum TaxID=2596890 RepID=A0A5S9ISK8_UABAM|nr:protein kinase [Candidatus Uabimicrobium amorphum]BBM86846.1 protein kinase [Candidatus Uabimicrobium amorphum]
MRIKIKINCPSCKEDHKIIFQNMVDRYECPNTGQIFEVDQNATVSPINDIDPTIRYWRSIEASEYLYPLFQTAASSIIEQEKTKTIDLDKQKITNNLNENATGSQKLTIDKYEILEKISEGGYGIVYKAFDRSLKRHVAIKKSKFILDEKGIEQFEKEAQIVAKFNHPNIVHIYDFGIDEQHIPYIVMEYVEGDNIKEFFHEKRDESRFEANVCEYFAQLADALNYIHQKNIYHQDIKPQNILVSFETKKPKIVDFGIAIIGDATNKENTSGTLRYIAPERLDKNKPAPSHDIYSLGATLYEVLTGRYANDGEFLPQILAKSYIDKSFKSEDRISEELKTICLKCLKSSQKERYSDTHTLHLHLIEHAGEFSNENIYPYLYMIDNQGGKILLPLKKRNNYLGRSFNNDIVIQHTSISRTQALIRVEEGKVTIENLSRNESIVVQSKVVNEKTELLDMSLIQISDYEFMYLAKNTKYSDGKSEKNDSLEQKGTSEAIPKSQNTNLSIPIEDLSKTQVLKFLQITEEELINYAVDGYINLIESDGDLFFSKEDVQHLHREIVNKQTVMPPSKEDMKKAEKYEEVIERIKAEKYIKAKEILETELDSGLLDLGAAKLILEELKNDLEGQALAPSLAEEEMEKCEKLLEERQLKRQLEIERKLEGKTLVPSPADKIEILETELDSGLLDLGQAERILENLEAERIFKELELERELEEKKVKNKEQEKFAEEDLTLFVLALFVILLSAFYVIWISS